MYTFAKSTELPNMLVLRKTPDNSEIRLEKTGNLVAKARFTELYILITETQKNTRQRYTETRSSPMRKKTKFSQ